jgi:hypothetical protein
MAEVRFGCGEYTVGASIGELASTYPSQVNHATLHDDFGVQGTDGTALVVTVMRAAVTWPDIVVSQRFSPGPDAGFYPGILVIPENRILLLGAGTRLLAYDLQARRRLWQDEANTGFWGWSRHGDVILMAAELEFAAWDAHARKLWSTYVEPPWSYDVAGSSVRLDVMGFTSDFPIRTGPSSGSVG